MSVVCPQPEIYLARGTFLMKKHCRYWIEQSQLCYILTKGKGGIAMITGINHKAFHVVDMERSLAFYCDKLGFKKAFELHQDNGDPWIVYIKVADGCFLELFYGGTEGERDRAEHICFEVEDVHETAAELESKGVVLATGISQGKALNYQFWVKDPDGNWIEFMQMHPDSPHLNS